IIALTISLPLILMSRRSPSDTARVASSQAPAAPAPIQASNNSALESEQAQSAEQQHYAGDVLRDSNSAVHPPAAATPSSASAENEAAAGFVAMARKEELRAKLTEAPRDQAPAARPVATELDDLKKKQAPTDSTERAASISGLAGATAAAPAT